MSDTAAMPEGNDGPLVSVQRPREHAAEKSSVGSEVVLRIHEYLCEQVSLCDQKAGLVVAATSGYLAYLVDKGASAGLQTMVAWSVCEWLGMSAVVLAVGAIVLGVFVIAPFTKSTESDGIVFWLDIVRAGVKENGRSAYVTNVMGLSQEQEKTKLVEHSHSLAVVVRRKFSFLRSAIWAGGVGLLIGILFLVLRCGY